jgi:hypothetical protein
LSQIGNNNKQSPPNLFKQDSSDFQNFAKASEDDPDFEDDQIDDDEEFGGASRAVKYSIKALHFNRMIFEKDP